MTVVAAVAAGVLAGVFALVGSWLGGRREHRQWLRDARRAAYSELNAAAEEMKLHRQLGEDIRTLSAGVDSALKDLAEEGLIVLQKLETPVELDKLTFENLLREQWKEQRREFNAIQARFAAAASAVTILGPEEVANKVDEIETATRQDNYDIDPALREFRQLSRMVLKST